MKLEYKNIFSLPTAFFCVIILCIGNLGINHYLKQFFPEKFEVKAEFSGPKGYSNIFETEDGLYTYRVNIEDSSAMIIKCNNAMMKSPKSKIKVPDRIDGHKVTVIGEVAFSFDEFLVELELPDCIEKIERGIVDNSPKMKKIIIKGNPKEVSEYTFIDFNGTVYAIKQGTAWKMASKHEIRVKEIKEHP